MAITVDTILLKFNVKPSYEQQEIQKMNADLKQAEANYESVVKAVKDNKGSWGQALDPRCLISGISLHK